MSDLIRRQSAINAIENTDVPMSAEEWDELTDAIVSIPAVDAVEVVHGWWRFDDFDGDGLDYTCSCCGLCSVDEYDYCPNCGAQMDGEDGDA